jgi:hypothetical protein
MSLKEEFANQVKAQAEVWQAQIKDYQEQLAQAGAKAKADYERSVAQMRSNAEEARTMAERLQKANETAWNDMRDAQQRAFAELQKGWAEALSRFL